ncbi:hypothetical protein Dsin_004794 [Dipteronia sinensis]|uniref:HTH myb-type domain-containing protein n=1 Tax=Dipteronia sinensis TaxID=43782 RepID=A0AAE0EEJ9_9ROSI|nr:hypothetical protein Dsin_004794 [Dipteronia sinensis]
MAPNKKSLNRCGRSCRLRWLNYLRPNIKRGNISDEEEDLILRLHKLLGNRVRRPKIWLKKTGERKRDERCPAPPPRGGVWPPQEGSAAGLVEPTHLHGKPAWCPPIGSFFCLVSLL